MSSSSSNSKTVVTGLLDFSKYSIESYILPVWSGNIVYNESLMFVPNPITQVIDPSPLLYKPDKIISVRSSNFKTIYTEGIDYTVVNGCIKLTTTTKIPVWTMDEYFPTTPAAVPICSISTPGRFVQFGGGDLFMPTQIAVTYTHSDKWTGIKPTYSGDKLPKTIKLLNEKKPIKILYYGDSITVGCEASGWAVQGREAFEPFMPIWTDMVTEELKKAYGYNNITSYNTAVGGQQTNWGLSNVNENVINYKPDLIFIAFGMNDSGAQIGPELYQRNISNIIKLTRAANPNAEFVLVSTSLPNPDANGWTLYTPVFEDNLHAIVKSTSGVVLAPMTSVHKYILQKKRYPDMTGNNINHPNDFLARVYAQTVAQQLVKDLK